MHGVGKQRITNAFYQYNDYVVWIFYHIWSNEERGKKEKHRDKKEVVSM